MSKISSRAGGLVGDLPRPDISLPSLPDISRPDLAGRVPHLRLPDVDISELGDRLRELPAVGAVADSVSRSHRSPLSRMAVPLAVAGVAIGAVLVIRRRGRRSADRPAS